MKKFRPLTKKEIDFIINYVDRKGKEFFGSQFDYRKMYKKCKWSYLTKDIYEVINIKFKEYLKIYNDLLNVILCYDDVERYFNIDLRELFNSPEKREYFSFKYLFKILKYCKVKVYYNFENFKIKIKDKKINDKLKYKILIKIFNKIGMEVEFNINRIFENNIISDFLINDVFSEYKKENDTIFEWITYPFKYNYKNLMFIFNELTHYFNNDFKLWKGGYDKYAESNHLHFSFVNNEIKEKIIKNYKNLFILFLPLFNRNGKFFRDSVYKSNYSIIKRLYSFPNDSKTYYVTTNCIGTIELRGNENTFPYYIIMLEYLLKWIFINNDKRVINKVNQFINGYFENFGDRLEREINIYDIFKYFLPFYNYIIRKIKRENNNKFTNKMLNLIYTVFNNEKYHPNINYNIWMMFNKRFKNEIIEFNKKNNIKEIYIDYYDFYKD